MRSQVLRCFTVGLIATLAGTVQATDLTLQQVTFPERKQVDIGFTRDSRAPDATLAAEVEYREGQASMKIRFRNMKPAVLFGGDVTSYVLWAVTRDGTVENLGELWVRNASDSVAYSTGLKSFALMVTAESHPLVSAPSDLVMFWSEAVDSKKAKSTPFTFSAFEPAPKIEYPSIAKVIWDGTEPLDLAQAEKAFELAEEAGAEEYAPSVFQRAKTTLAQAQNFSKGNKSKELMDYSRRSLALSAEALQVTKRQKEAEAVEAEIARRTAEMQALEEQASSAKTRAEEAEESTAAATAALAESRAQKEQADAAVEAAQRELDQIVAERLQLQAEVSMLSEQAAGLEREKAELSSRLAGALSQVADTQSSARGMIVSLPDILFDTNEATLKSEARVVLAKLAGILLILPDLNLRIEGHTDSTGSAEYNQQLSEKRATSVRVFLTEQGIAASRMVAVGYGFDRPVASNDTREGRAKNRRVEIVIAEGEVAAD